ncbi:MAG: L-rhamnose isomerase [Oscillospiraceae bacterium]|jgi:L-rhamnose isomerase|nr:L-rhamnose isomerase [Oscillospiraceae bacterium]
MDKDTILKNYDGAKRAFASLGVSTDAAVAKLKSIPVSVHNWQGDDVRGFEGGSEASQNLVTGNYPGRARNGDEMRRDLEFAMKFSPLTHKVNIHSMYAEPAARKDRCDYDIEDFSKWVNWAKENKLGLDFNVSYFTHAMMNDGNSLASPDKKTRDYWIKNGIAGRRISAEIGRRLGQVCMNNLWVPDGTKDIPADKYAWRKRLTDSLDEIYEAKYDDAHTLDTVEGKVFGVGTESFVVGSHDFYLAYALKRGVGVTFDTGHYHPTEDAADKISAVVPFVKCLQLHLTRGIRWDSDHVLIQDDSLRSILREINRMDAFSTTENPENKVHVGLDYFDASINRVGAWIIGLRAAGKALLAALLEPTRLLREAEERDDKTLRLALTDELNNLPVNAVWDYVCETSGSGGREWIDALKIYEAEVQLKR